jgi:CBS domain-containing protein
VQRRIIPDLVSGKQELIVLPRAATVAEAALRMYRLGVGAVLVVERGHLLGIFTERDLTRCIAFQLDLPAIPLGLVMTRDPPTVRPQEAVSVALERMRAGRCHHLPVVDEGRPLGLVSVRDVFALMRPEPDDEPHGREARARWENYDAVAA